MLAQGARFCSFLRASKRSRRAVVNPETRGRFLVAGGNEEGIEIACHVEQPKITFDLL